MKIGGQNVRSWVSFANDGKQVDSLNRKAIFHKNYNQPQDLEISYYDLYYRPR